MELPREAPAEIVFFGSDTEPGTVAERGIAARDRSAGFWLLAQKSTNTRAAYTRDIRDFFAWADEWQIEVFAARRGHLDAYREYLTTHGDGGRATFAPSTVARKLSAVASFYTYLVQESEGLVRVNPLQNVTRPEVTEESMTAGLDLDESARLEWTADRTGHRESAMVRLLVTVGLRVSEVCSANVTDLGRERGHRTITVVRKGGRRQRIAVPRNTAAVLDRYLDGRRTGPLFLGLDGERITRAQIAYYLRVLGERAGLEKRVTPHVMRHTAATTSLDAGASLRDVQTLLGHIDPRTTNRYDRTRHDVDRSPVHLIDRPLPREMTE